MGRATIKDVADFVGVSPSTISRALNAPEMVRKETVEKIQEATKILNYTYNSAAANLANSCTDALGVIIPSSEYSAFAINLTGVLEVCSRHNFNCRIAASRFDSNLEREAMHKFHEQRISGLIMAGVDEENCDYLQQMMDDGIPSIVLWEVPRENFNYIAVNNYKAAHEVVEYLISLGHKEIAFLSGPVCARRNADKIEGYKSALADGGLPFRPELVHSQLPTFLGGKAGMKSCLACPHKPTAVICASDYLAIGAIRAIQDAGLSVPEDISVCGFDDVDISAFFNPPITTMKTQAEFMGRTAADMLIRAISQRKPLDIHYMLEAELVVRKSCKLVKAI